MRIYLNSGRSTTSLYTNPVATFAELAESFSRDNGRLCSRHEVWFQHNGRRCKEEQTLGAAGVHDDSFVYAHLRLRGGGGDGGATGAESRASYLEMYMQKKPDKVDRVEEKLARATTCMLSGQTLEPPCVYDELGSLYNKEAVVTALISKSMPSALGHISSLKHVSDAKLCQIVGSTKESGVKFCCPISGQTLNGQHRFCILLPTGHVVSEKAVSQVAPAVEEHLGGKWSEKFPLNGSKEEVEALWDRLIAKRSAAKKGKKEKRKLSIAAELENGHAASGRDSEVSEGNPNGKRQIQDFTLQDKAEAKKIKAADLAPAHADKKIWASLFTSAHAPIGKETYSCRSTSARGWV